MVIVAPEIAAIASRSTPIVMTYPLDCLQLRVLQSGLYIELSQPAKTPVGHSTTTAVLRLAYVV